MCNVLNTFGITLLLAVASVPILSGQTCCSAGAPLVSSYGIRSSINKSLMLHLDYNYTSINRLVNENSILKNDPRKRNVHTLLVKADFVLNKNWAFGINIPMRNHNRITVSEDQASTGIGDVVLLSQYSLLSKNENHGLRFSIGFKLPTGVEEHKDSRGIFLSPDMQSGTGTFDFISRLSFQKNRIAKSNLNAQIGILYRINTTNDHFGASNGSTGREFKFGNEWQFDISLHYEFLVASVFVIPDVHFKLRTTVPNDEQGREAPNSGGKWLSSTIGIYILANERFGLRVYFGLPLYQDLEGLQITTDHELGIEVSYKLNLTEPEQLNDKMNFKL